MKSSSASDGPIPKPEPGFWKQTTSRGISGGISAIIVATALGVFAAIAGILRGTLHQWLHLLDSVWLITVCAAIVLFAVGFIIGVSYATVGAVYVVEFMFASILHQPKPKRDWWLAPIDWLAIVGVWLGAAVLLVQMNASAKLKAVRPQGQEEQQATTDESERLREEIERLRAELEKLRAQAPNASNASEGQLSLRARVLPSTTPTTAPADTQDRS